MGDPLILCPNCPLCGQPPKFVLAGAVQAFCGNDTCDLILWNPSETLDDNLTNAGIVGFGMDGEKGP